MNKSCNLKGTQKVFYIQQNKIASCCRAHPDVLDISNTLYDYITQWEIEAEQLRQGSELIGCETCWVNEKQNLPSFRTQSLTAIASDRIELYLSNACNQQCSYCSPKFSSEWESSIKTHGAFQNVSVSSIANQKIAVASDTTEYWLSQINDYLTTCADQSVTLVLLGGEPLMQRSNLETFLNLNNSKIKVLNIFTNLNPPNNKFLKYILDNFDKEKLEFSISIDAVPDWNHVPRAKFNSVAFKENLQLLKDHKIEYQFLSVLSVLNIFDLARYLQWTDHSRQQWNVLSNPKCLDVTSIPRAWREKIWNGLISPPKVVEDQLLAESEPIDILLFEQYNYMLQYFQRVGINPMTLPNQLFVEYWAFLERKFK